MLLRLPGLTGIAVQIDHVLDGLIAMRILAHIFDGHLLHLMDHAAIGAETILLGRVNTESILVTNFASPPIRLISPWTSWKTDQL
jgi:hypothetical protein